MRPVGSLVAGQFVVGLPCAPVAVVVAVEERPHADRDIVPTHEHFEVTSAPVRPTLDVVADKQAVRFLANWLRIPVISEASRANGSRPWAD